MMRELKLFFTGLSFFTRIPFPKCLQFEKELQYQAIKYFPLAGSIVGGVAALAFCLFKILLPFDLSVILSMGISVLFTGALHEDGFMDVCDGFGGGWTKTKILEIMKDSSSGAFGLTGIVFLILIKFLCQTSISPNQLPWVLIAAHSSSRMLASCLPNLHQYARSENSKSKDYLHKLKRGNFALMLTTGLLPFALLEEMKFLLILLPSTLCMLLLGRYYQKWIGGFTGDCIGATQQICELVFYFSYLIIVNF